MTRIERIELNKRLGLSFSHFENMTDAEFNSGVELEEYRNEYRDGFKPVKLPRYVGSSWGRN